MNQTMQDKSNENHQEQSSIDTGFASYFLKREKFAELPLILLDVKINKEITWKSGAGVHGLPGRFPWQRRQMIVQRVAVALHTLVDVVGSPARQKL